MSNKELRAVFQKSDLTHDHHSEKTRIVMINGPIESVSFYTNSSNFGSTICSKIKVPKILESLRVYIYMHRWISGIDRGWQGLSNVQGNIYANGLSRKWHSFQVYPFLAPFFVNINPSLYTIQMPFTVKRGLTAAYFSNKMED